MNPVYLRIIADVHGYVTDPPGWYAQVGKAADRTYANLIADVPNSIQLGDLGFSTEWKYVKEHIFDNHKILGGNHDDYDYIEANDIDNYLGNFGEITIGKFSAFFIRGGNSIDVARRTPGESWWPQEELNREQAEQAFAAYKRVKPKIVLSHDCPWELYPFVVTNNLKIERPNSTAILLNECYAFHPPDLWIFGHHHNNIVVNYEDTQFICLNELCYMDFDKNGNMLYKEPQ
ncbi:MAG: metallophosphoesterase family protein [Planctomycetota bacterium]|jgi:hypothetical protein